MQNNFQNYLFLKIILLIILLTQKWNVTLIFADADVETLAGVVTCKEVYRNLMPPEETKVSFFPFIGPFKQLLIGGITAFRIQFYGYTKRKKTHTMTFLPEECLKPLDNRIGLHIFFRFRI